MYFKILATLAFVTLTLQLGPLSKRARYFNRCVTERREFQASGKDQEGNRHGHNYWTYPVRFCNGR